jgi:pimeloyl-ACP methyl ester carboxylesterase
MASLALPDGVRLAYRDHGQGEAILFLHGFPVSGAMWDPQVQACGGEFRTVVPDLRGHGGSDAPALDSYPMDLFAGDALALLDALGIERAVVVALSLGGYVAFALFRLAPERVRALVLADTRAAADTPESARGRKQLAARVRREGTAPAIDSMLPKLLAPGSAARDPGLLGRIEAMMRQARPAGVAASLTGLAERPDCFDLLPRISVPALIVVGGEDAITPPEESERMASRLPDASLMVIPGAGHVSNLEAPEAFNRALLGFLGRL